MIDEQRLLGIVPARGGSKGIPRKNLINLGGKPLIQWTIDVARQSRHIDLLVVTSDDQEIIDVAVAAGCEAPFRRAAALATDTASSTDVVRDVLERVPDYGLFVLLQPTSPLRIAEDIDGAIELMLHRNADFCVSVTEATNHPYLTFCSDCDNYLRPFVEPPPGQSLRRQDLPPAWSLNGAVYAGRRARFLEIGGFLSARTVAYAMPRGRSLDIDDWEDVETFQRAIQD